MSFPSQNTLNRLSTPNRSNSYSPNDSFIDQFLRKISFEAVCQSGDAYEYNKADKLPIAAFFSKNTSVPIEATDVEMDSVRFERTGDHLELDQFDSASGRDVDQFEQQVRGVKLGILRQLSNKLIEGTASPSILGLRIQTGATVGAANNATNGGFVTLQDLYKIKYLCTPTDNFVGAGADCWVSNEKTLREVLGLIDTSSRSQTIEWQYDKALGVRIPIILGLPWYISNSVPLNETKGTGTNLTSIYVVKITGSTSVKILYAEDPNVPCDEWGITVYDIPIQSNQNKRLKAVVGYYALYSPENRCIVRLNGIKPNQFAL